MFLRSRITRWMLWMALAATAMYFFDPDRGEQRRRELRARLEAATPPRLRGGGGEAAGGGPGQ